MMLDHEAAAELAEERRFEARFVQTSPHTEAIHLVPCPSCPALGTGTVTGGRCSEPERRSNYRYVVAPHPARVEAAGFRIVNHPTDSAVRWYAPLTS